MSFNPLKPSEQAVVVTDAGSLYGKGQSQFLRWKGLRAEARLWGTKSWESLGEERVEGTSHGRAWHRTVEFLLNDGQPFRRDSTFIHSGQSMDRGTESSSEAGTKPSVKGSLAEVGEGWDVLWVWRSKRGGAALERRTHSTQLSQDISLWATCIPLPEALQLSVRHSGSQTLKWCNLQLILQSKTRGQREAPDHPV